MKERLIRIKIIDFININNSRQCISIRTCNPENPVLLYLHGGPGDAAIPLVAKYSKQLEKIFTVVTLEQRGAGKSFYPFAKSGEITINTFVDDIYMLSTYLLKRFNQEKLYLVGHSWGSVLGLRFIQLYPDLVNVYVGCGQVINMMKSEKIAYDFVLQKNKEMNNMKIIKKLELIDYSYSQETWLKDLLFVKRQVVKHKGSLYEKTNYNRFILDFLVSTEYNLWDVFNRLRGSMQSIKHLWQELMSINFEDINEFEVPVVFVAGRGDYHVSSDLVYEFFLALKSPKQFHWFENSCHFPQWCEPQKFYEVMKSTVIP